MRPTAGHRLGGPVRPRAGRRLGGPVWVGGYMDGLSILARWAWKPGGPGYRIRPLPGARRARPDEAQKESIRLAGSPAHRHSRSLCRSPSLLLFCLSFSPSLPAFSLSPPSSSLAPLPAPPLTVGPSHAAGGGHGALAARLQDRPARLRRHPPLVTVPGPARPAHSITPEPGASGIPRGRCLRSYR